jgi:hypothetical protein
VLVLVECRGVSSMLSHFFDVVAVVVHVDADALRGRERVKSVPSLRSAWVPASNATLIAAVSVCMMTRDS